MAEFGSHLTSNKRDDEEPPSIFDVIAQANLVSSLRPALSHIFRVLAVKNPARYGLLYAYCDEVYTVLHFLLENHHLKKHIASFAENFYGLKRFSTERNTSSVDNGLSQSERLRSLFYLVMAPYIKDKCDKYFEQLQEKSDDGNLSAKTWKAKLCRTYVAVYPIIHLAWESTMFCFQIAYALGKTKYHSPFLLLSGVALAYLTPEDMLVVTSGNYNWKDKSVMQKLVVLWSKLYGALLVGLSSSLSVGLFFLQFMEWWYARDHQETSITSLPNPPPPRQDSFNDSLPKLHTLCPLCHRIRTNDTVLAITGYVFCYRCIWTYVENHGRCPVSGLPADIQHLVKLYLTDT